MSFELDVTEQRCRKTEMRLAKVIWDVEEFKGRMFNPSALVCAYPDNAAASLQMIGAIICIMAYELVD
jgi:hypothetical protein